MRFVNCAKVFSAVIKKANVYESTKLHILNCHLNLFSTNLADKSDEHGERFHQDLKPHEIRYAGKSHASMLADYVWQTVSDNPNVNYKKK